MSGGGVGAKGKKRVSLESGMAVDSDFEPEKTGGESQVDERDEQK